MSVSDTGIGIQDYDRERLFRRFSRTREGMQLDINGMGLGLTICSKLVKQFGGKIDFFSEFGKGSTFEFTF